MVKFLNIQHFELFFQLPTTFFPLTKVVKSVHRAQVIRRVLVQREGCRSGWQVDERQERTTRAQNECRRQSDANLIKVAIVLQRSQAIVVVKGNRGWDVVDTQLR